MKEIKYCACVLSFQSNYIDFILKEGGKEIVFLVPKVTLLLKEIIHRTCLSNQFKLKKFHVRIFIFNICARYIYLIKG